MIFLNAAILILGFAALVKGADIFVDGSGALAALFKVSELVIGLTIVALGTSMPELAVSVTAALDGSNEIALSNVVGSNIFNLLVVLGMCAAIHSVPVDSAIIKRDFPISIAYAIIVLAASSFSSIFGGNFFSLKMSDNAGLVSRALGIFLFASFIAYIAALIIDARRHPTQEEDIKALPLWKCLLFILLGLILITAGGKAVVYSARNVARFFGMTETLIGLTIVALGTSLPELVTSIIAAKKGQTELAVGNVVGSNIFNLLLILGVSSTIHPVAVNAASVYDLAILIFTSLLAWAFSIPSKRVNRLQGAAMLLCYVAATIFAAVR